MIGRARDRGRMLAALDSDIRTTKLWFRVLFYTEDYLILAANNEQLSEQELVDTGVCSRPFSPYSTLVDLYEVNWIEM